MAPTAVINRDKYDSMENLSANHRDYWRTNRLAEYIY